MTTQLEPASISEPHAEANVQTLACGNCDASLEAGDRYCAACGQRHRPERLNFSHVVADVYAQFVSLDRGILFTVARLTHAPGAVITDYWRGRRRTYMSPIAYLVFGAASGPFLDRWNATGNALARGRALREAAALGGSAHAALYMKMRQFLWTNPAAMALLQVLIFTLLIQLLFRRESRERLTLGEAGVAACYTVGHLLLLTSVLGTLLIHTTDYGSYARHAGFMLLFAVPLSVFAGAFGRRASVLLRALAVPVLTMIIISLVWKALIWSLLRV